MPFGAPEALPPDIPTDMNALMLALTFTPPREERD